MARPTRRPVPRKQSVQQVQLGVPALPVSAEQKSEVDDLDRQKLVDDFGAALDKQSSLDREERDFILEQYKAAVENASIESKLTPDVDRATWIETVELLSRDQSTEQTDSDALIRQFDEAMQPLQSPRIQLALEYVQRLQQYGEANAMEWLQSQHGKHEQSAASGVVLPTTWDSTSMRQSITKSRSRRLRGPPTQG